MGRLFGTDDYVPPKPVIAAKPDEILSGISGTADTAE